MDGIDTKGEALHGMGAVGVEQPPLAATRCYLPRRADFFTAGFAAPRLRFPTPRPSRAWLFAFPAGFAVGAGFAGEGASLEPASFAAGAGVSVFVAASVLGLAASAPLLAPSGFVSDFASPDFR